MSEISSVELTASSKLAEYGIVGIIVLVFAYVIIFLYKESKQDQTKMNDERKAMDAERQRWILEREGLKAETRTCTEACKAEKESLKTEYEKRAKENLEGYVHQLMQDRESSKKREDDIRKDSQAFVERISQGARDSNEALVEMLQKVHDKLVK